MKQFTLPAFLLVMLIYAIQGCDFKNNNARANQTSRNQHFAYKLQEPKDRIFLPYELEEISGLTHFGGTQLACIQDEQGYLYTFDYERKAIISKMRFEKDGDYEGITLAKNYIYVAKNNGTLYQININDSTKVSTTFKTRLSSKNDIEGLTYDQKKNRLLIACKGNPYFNDKDKDDIKAIYAFDLEKKELLDKPVFEIKIKDIKKYFKQHDIEWKKGIIGPSGIAIHPKTHEIYVLSHIGKLLIVLSPKGDIKNIQQLKGSLYRQPEGIAFTKDGTMYISNEGDGGRGSILIFNYQVNEK